MSILTVVSLSSASYELQIPTNVPVSGSLDNVQNEEQVWICPADTSVIVVIHRDLQLGYRQVAIATSFDGGYFWYDVPLDPLDQSFPLQSDPFMTVTAQGSYVLGYLDFAHLPGFPTFDSSHIAIITSSDCGTTWNGPYTIEDSIGDYFEDKPFSTSDRTSGPYSGSVYVAWSRLTGSIETDEGLRVARSPDGGITWSDPVKIGGYVETSCYGFVSSSGGFAQPLVDRDGTLYVFWMGAEVDSSSGCSIHSVIGANRSFDGGISWSGQRIIRRIAEAGTWIEGNITVYSNPVTDADISDGPYGGNLYLQYRDRSQAPPFDSEILFQRSLDTGHTWSTPFRVNDDPIGPDVDQFHNWMVINEEGILTSIWYDQRTDPAHYLFDVFAAYSFDGGETWTSNHRVSSQSIDPDLLGFNQSAETGAQEPPWNPVIQSPLAGRIAEYIGVSCVGDKVFATWTDTREGTQDVWGAPWYLFLTDPRPLSPVFGQGVATCDSLWWASGWKESEDSYRLQIATDTGFIDIIRDMTVSDNSFQLALAGLPDSQYFWRVKNYRASGGTPAESTAFSAPFSYVQQDLDADCVADAIDNCPNTPNPQQSDADGDSVGDACDACTDSDGDGFGDPGFANNICPSDNCPALPNPGQEDLDSDGVGDLCDNCPEIYNPNQGDSDLDGVGDACQCACLCHGDPGACDGIRDIVDVVQTVNVAFRNAAPISDPSVTCSYETTDVDCSLSTDVVDVVKMVDVAFRSGNIATEFCKPCP